MFRYLYEKFNIYIYLLIPVFVMIFYVILRNNDLLNLQAISNYNNHKFDFVLTLLGTLLTVYGFMAMLPENKFRELLRKYKHDEILNNTVFIGVLSSMIFIVMFMLGFENIINDFMFLIALSETIIASFKIFRLLKVSSKSTHQQ